jgi:hypothetical protein
VAGEPKTYTQDELDALIAERLASETEGLKKSQAQLLKEKKDAQARAALFEGLDPDEAKALKAKIAEMEQTAKAQAAGITSEALAKLRQEAAAEYEKKYGPVLTERDQLKSEIRGLKLDSNVKAMMAKAGARAERIDALFKLSSDRFDLTEDGKPMVKDATKEVDKFIAEDLLKEYPEFFQGSGSSGGGAAKSSGGGGGIVTRIAAPANGVFGSEFLSEPRRHLQGHDVTE